jgi:hypothetical protein
MQVQIPPSWRLICPSHQKLKHLRRKSELSLATTLGGHSFEDYDCHSTHGSDLATVRVLCGYYLEPAWASVTSFITTSRDCYREACTRHREGLINEGAKTMRDGEFRPPVVVLDTGVEEGSIDADQRLSLKKCPKSKS